MAFGRPPEYKPEYCSMLIEHMVSGLSFDSFAGVIMTSKESLYNWCDKYDDFVYAKKIGTSASLLKWERMGIEGLYGNKENTFNSTVWIFNMRNRFGWRNETSEEMREKAEATAKAMAAAIKPADPIDVIKSALTDPFMKDKLKDLIKEL